MAAREREDGELPSTIWSLLGRKVRQGLFVSTPTPNLDLNPNLRSESLERIGQVQAALLRIGQRFPSQHEIAGEPQSDCFLATHGESEVKQPFYHQDQNSTRR